jgi:hypothetical protein
MVAPYRDADRFLAALVEMAEELRQEIRALSSDAERSDHLMNLIAESDMVFGVWPDAGADEGVGIQIIKGSDRLPPLVAFETENEVHVAAVPCVSREIAFTAREIWGTEPDDSAGQPISASTALAMSEVARLEWVVTRRP